MKHAKYLFTLLAFICCSYFVSAQCPVVSNFTYSFAGSLYVFHGTQTGGTGTIQYAWIIDGTATPFRLTTNDTVTLSTGAHNICVIARDANNCYDTTCRPLYAGCNIGSGITPDLYGSYASLSASSVNTHGHVSYHWSNGATSQSIVVQSSALYCVTVTDSTGCYTSSCYGWSPCTVPTTITSTHTPNNAYTFSGSLSGGAHPPYTYDWWIDGSLQTSHSLTLPVALTAGTHSVCFRAVDSTLCVGYRCDTIAVTGTNPCTLNAVSFHDTLTYTGVPQVEVLASGGQAPYTYTWSTGASSGYFIFVYPHLPATYCVTVSDANGCTASACHTGCTFQATVTDSIVGSMNYYHLVSSGHAFPSRIYWNGQISTSPYYSASTTVSQVTVAVKDSAGCFFLDTLHPHPCTAATAITTTHTPDNHYTFAANTTGGTAPLTYAWTVNGYAATIHSAVLADSLATGTYIICASVTDADHCSGGDCDTVTVTAPVHCTLSVYVHDTLGAYYAHVANATNFNFTYHWNTGSTGMSTPYSAQVHCVTVTDGQGCAASSCDTSCTLTGYAYHVTSGNGWNQYAVPGQGTAPYHYHWSSGDTTQGFYTTSQGIYYVTITDAHGCSVVGRDTLGAPCTIQGYLSLSNGTSAAIITANVFGGRGHISYHWSNAGSTTNILTVVNAGRYCVTATDTIGCSVVLCDTVSPGCHLVAHLSDSSFAGGKVITALTDSGTAPYTYTWTNSYGTLAGQTSAALTTYISGNFCAHITDGNGCTTTACDTFYIPCVMQVHISDSDYGSYHLLTAQTTGSPAGTTTYQWSNFGGATIGTGASLYVQQSGYYCVSVTGSNGCHTLDCDSVTIGGCTLNVGLSYTHTAGNAYTFQGTQTGGHGPVSYTYYIYNNTYGPTTGQAGPVTLPAGTYHFWIEGTDSSHCYDSASVTVVVSPATTCALHATVSSSHAGSAYTFTAALTGGTAPYTYRWTVDGVLASTLASPTLTLATASGTRRICLAVRDAAGCTDSVCTTVITATGCTLAGHITHVISGSTAILTASATGAHGAVTYQWTGSTSAAYTVTQSGAYCVVIRDTSGCAVTVCDTVQIGCTLHAALSATHTSANVYTFAATQSGGTSPYAYAFTVDGVRHTTGSVSAYTQTLSGGAHTVCVKVTSGNCTDSVCQTISVTTGCTLSGYITDVVTSSFYTAHHFAAVVLGGTAPYTYLWSNGITSQSFTMIGSNPSITCTVTDANGCTAVLHIGNIPCTLTATTTVQNNGSYAIITAVVSGVHGHANYHWSNGGSTGNVLTVQTSGTYCLTVTDSTGCSATSCQYVTLNNNRDTICGTVFTDANANGVQDGADHGLNTQAVYLYSGTTLIGTYYTNAQGLYQISVPLGTYTLKYYAPSAASITVPVGSSSVSSLGIYSTVVVSQPGHRYCGYNFGVRDTNVTISGYVYFDANGDGIQNNGETGVSNQPVHVGPHLVYTNTNGYYVYVGPAGPYAITYVPSSAYAAYTVTPGSYSVSATTGGTVYGGNNFGLHAANTTCDIATTIIPVTTITAGFSAWYNVYVSNYGNNVASGTMTFYYDPVLTFTYANPVQASVNTSAHFVSFNYTGLLPGQYTSFTVHFTAATTVVPGLSTFEMATATDNCNETNFYNNTDTIHQIATGSWDPNVKVVTPAGEGTQGFITRDQELRYTLNFQNTGTAEAVNIVLKDSLSSLLDMSTLRIIGASHPDYAVTSDGHMIVCQFSQIMLPDSNTDEPGSHGYLSFAIKPVAGIADGVQIQNNAGIYFDYNEAVITNTTLNTIDYTLSVKELEEHATITVMPNPFSDYTTIRVVGVETHDAVLDVYNALGQVVAHTTPSAEGIFTLSRGALASGVYSYHITQSTQSIGSGKLVIQ